MPEARPPHPAANAVTSPASAHKAAAPASPQRRTRPASARLGQSSSGSRRRSSAPAPRPVSPRPRRGRRCPAASLAALAFSSASFPGGAARRHRERRLDRRKADERAAALDRGDEHLVRDIRRLALGPPGEHGVGRVLRGPGHRGAERHFGKFQDRRIAVDRPEVNVSVANARSGCCGSGVSCQFRCARSQRRNSVRVVTTIEVL